MRSAALKRFTVKTAEIAGELSKFYLLESVINTVDYGVFNAI